MFNDIVFDPTFYTVNGITLIVAVLIGIGILYYTHKSICEMKEMKIDHLGMFAHFFIFYAQILKHGFPLAPLFILLVVLINYAFGIITTWGELLRAIPAFIGMTIFVRFFTFFMLKKADNMTLNDS